MNYYIFGNYATYENDLYIECCFSNMVLMFYCTANRGLTKFFKSETTAATDCIELTAVKKPKI